MNQIAPRRARSMAEMADIQSALFSPGMFDASIAGPPEVGTNCMYAGAPAAPFASGKWLCARQWEQQSCAWCDC